MRILHIDTERGWRGGERQALWLAQSLQRRGHPSVIAARPDEPLAQRAREAGLEVVPCSPSFEADPVAVFNLRRRLRELRIDIVHAHTGHAVGLGALATLGTTVKLVVSRRVDFPLRRNAGTRWKYGRAAAIIAISRAVADVLTRSGVAQDHIAVIPDGVDMQRAITPASSDTLRSLGVRSEAPLVVQVAQLVPHKDPLSFVRAIAVARERVPSLQALLVGDGSLQADVAEAVISLRLEGTLYATGYRQDADALLAAADVVVLSSREEGMGSVLLDALYLGKPIAATRAGGIPEVITHEVTGLLSPVSDSSALGSNVAALLEDRVLAARLATAARARAAAFSIERLTDRTLTVYERVLSGAPLGDLDATNRRTDAAIRASSLSSTRAP
ncbi:MAG TPA: glycosyltransferase family 4 protein [Gemmatimonadaceae bacterium]|nr:glycosyltransferase family 4 protein [Gemmatimonadaceae bacterium]